MIFVKNQIFLHYYSYLCNKWATQFGCILLLITLTLTSLVLATPVNAQGGVQWDQPVNLSNTPGLSTRPAVAVDPWGQIHVFWSEVEDLPSNTNEGRDQGDTIYYRRWDGTSWSEPIDLFFTSDPFDKYVDPAVAVDSEGTIHLLWKGEDGVHYSQSSALLPISAKSWQSDQIIAESSFVDQVELAIDSSNQIHVVFNRADLTADGYVFYLNSVDGGETWTSPQRVSIIYNRETEYLSYPRITVDAADRLHVIWIEQSAPPDFRGLGFYYARSDDNGSTWSEPFNLTEGSVTAEPWAGLLVPLDQNNLLTVYVGGDSTRAVDKVGLTYRHYRISRDGGQTWSPPQHIFGELHSLAGWDAAVVDDTGTLYLLAQLRYPEGMYMGTWNQGIWPEVPEALLTQPPLNTAHYPQMVTSAGNQLHIVMEEHPAGEIWYMHGTTQAPSVQLKLIPTPQQSPTPQPTLTALPTAIVEATPTRHIFNNDEEVMQNSTRAASSPSYPLFIGLAATTLVIGAVILAQKVLKY